MSKTVILLVVVWGTLSAVRNGLCGENPSQQAAPSAAYTAKPKVESPQPKPEIHVGKNPSQQAGPTAASDVKPNNESTQAKPAISVWVEDGIRVRGIVSGIRKQDAGKYGVRVYARIDIWYIQPYVGSIHDIESDLTFNTWTREWYVIRADLVERDTDRVVAMAMYKKGDPRPDRPSQGENPSQPTSPHAASAGTLTQGIDVQRLSAFAEKGMKFIHDQRISGRWMGRGSSFNGLYQSFKADPRNPDSQYLAKYGRVWIYDQALAIYAELKYGHREHARQAIEALIGVAEYEKTKGFRGLWHFSYNTVDDDFVDPRGPLGANLWALSSILAYIQETGDTRRLPWVNQVLTSYVFPQQVMDSEDRRFGLFRAGLENPFDLGRGDGMGYHVYEGTPSDFQKLFLQDTQRQSQIILGFFCLGMPHPLNQPVAGINEMLSYLRSDKDRILNSQVEFVSIEHNADVLATLRMAEAVNRRVDPETTLLPEIRRRHAMVLNAMNRMWVRDPSGQEHFVTGMNGDGTLNLSVAVDNNTWVGNAILPYDEERAWQCIQYTRRHFWTEDDGFAGLFFFDKEFKDKYVQMPDADRRQLERMIQPEATWGFIHFLKQFAAQTRDARRKAEAQAMMNELVAGMLGFQEYFAANQGRYARTAAQWVEVVQRLGCDTFIGIVNEPRRFLEGTQEELEGINGYFNKCGTPYASRAIKDYFTTLEGIAGTATGTIVALELLGKRDDDFIGVRPSTELLERKGGSN